MDEEEYEYIEVVWSSDGDFP